MDDGDGALAIEMMAGKPAQEILQTIYNGSSSCSGCGCTLSPLTTLYTGGQCADCMTKSSGKRAQQLLGR